MCRKQLSLFELCHATSSDNGADPSSLVYAGETDIVSWPIANFEFDQRPLIPMRNPGNLLQKMIDERGILGGFGIKFCFGPIPSMEFARPLIGFGDGDRLLHSANFDTSRFHQKSMTFHGKKCFDKLVCNSKKNSYCYNELSCLLHFSDSANYIRKGMMRWKLAGTSSFLESYPLDGVWEVEYESGIASKILVQRHFFSCFNLDYNITIDTETNCARFLWPNGSVEQNSKQQILPGTRGPDVGDSLEWKTSEQEQVVWKRVTVDLEDCWRSVDIVAGGFVYQKCIDHQRNDESLGPSYHVTTIWGNTFCQCYSVGLASYHFEEPDADDNFKAYISYESPRCEMWPTLDNGESIPSRVPFRNIHWEPETRTFKGDICWEQDFGTTWMNESKWSYEIEFDPAFLFVVSGTCSRSMGQAHQFGSDLIYVNAALEALLRDTLQAAETTEGYLSFVNQCRDSNASSGTVEMIGEVAMSVMGNQESMFDFNL